MKSNCFDNCEASLCPLETSHGAQWFPDESVCNSKSIAKPPWVKTQRKIQRLFLKGLVLETECFTIDMLQGIKRVGKGLHGMKPENLYRKEVSLTSQKPSISRRIPFLKAKEQVLTGNKV